MSGVEIVESIETMRNGETRVIDLRCGSVLKIKRFEKAFRLLVVDDLNFARANFLNYDGSTLERVKEESIEPPGGLESNRLYLFIDDNAIPTLRALLCGMQRSIRQ